MSFPSSEPGVVTVEWVVMTAAGVGLAMAIDSIDNSVPYGLGEGPVLYVDGVEIARATPATTGIAPGYNGTIHDGNPVWTPAPGFEDIEIETSVSQSGSNIGASGWADGVHQVRITMDDPGDEVRMGFGVITNQPISDETIGIDSFAITTAGLGR